MGTIKRRGLAVCMAALLMLSGLTAAAAEPLQAESGDALENAAAVSGGNADTDVETPGEMDSTEKGNLSDIVGNPAEDQITAYAADDIASGTDGDITWVIDASGKLTVTGTGDLSGAHYESGFAWRPYSDQIISAEINVTGMTDASYLFSGCSNLTSLDVSGFDTSNVTDMRWMFYGCSGLTSLDVSGFDTSNVAYMWQMFEGCSGLTSLDVSGFDTSNVTYMGWMFYGCSGLTSLDVSGFDTSNVTDMRWMFSGCSSLTTIQSPYNVNTSAPLPVVTGTVWTLPDGTEVTELPQGLSNSVTLIRSGTPTTPQITTTTPDLSMEDVVRVKYVPYSYTVETNNTDPDNTVTFSIVEGELAEGLQIYPATGEIYGVPLEAGEFKIKVMATYSNPAYLPSYAELTLTVLDNTDGNVGVATDSGYDITQPVIGFDTENMEGSSAQTLVSQGEYSQFRDVYIDGRKLTAEQDYTSQAGSTRITILNQTLASGGEGTHTLGIEFRTEDGTLKRAAQNYVIGKNVVGDNAGSNNGGSGDTENNNSSNSNNGNNSNNSNINSSLLPTTISSQQDFIIYTVERGDSLWKIAARFYGQGGSWRRIYEDNMAVIKNPHRLYAGQKLIIRLAGLAYPVQETPAPVSEAAVSEGTAYRVQKGDRL